MFPNPWVLMVCTFGLLIVLGTTSGVVRSRLWVSEPLICAIAGIALGPWGAGLIRLSPGSDSVAASVLEEVARVTLGIAVIGAAMRLPSDWLRQNWRGLAIILGPVMAMMWVVSGGLAFAILQLPLLTALMIAAAITPTDPVLSAPVLTGRLAETAVPPDVRHSLTAESGINDGLALPLVLLMILLTDHPPAEALGTWIVEAWLWEVGVAVGVGGAIGWVACRCLRWARNRPDAEPESMLTVGLALALASLAAVRALEGDGILAAFVAGAVLNAGAPGQYIEVQRERFSAAIGRFFDLPVMILFGAAIPWASWVGLGWKGLLFAMAILLLRRLPAVFLLRRTIPWLHSPRGAVFSGWFGPIGAGALFYALMLQDETGLAEIWPVVSLVIAASVVVHGVSGTALTWLFGRRWSPTLDRDFLGEREQR